MIEVLAIIALFELSEFVFYEVLLKNGIVMLCFFIPFVKISEESLSKHISDNDACSILAFGQYLS